MDCPVHSPAGLGAGATGAALRSCVVMCDELGCGLKLALATLLKQQVELETVWGLQVEVGEAELLGQEEQEEVKAQVQQETTQRSGLWPVPHCSALPEEVVQTEALLASQPFQAVTFPFCWLSPEHS